MKYLRNPLLISVFLLASISGCSQQEIREAGGFQFPNGSYLIKKSCMNWRSEISEYEPNGRLMFKIKINGTNEAYQPPLPVWGQDLKWKHGRVPGRVDNWMVEMTRITKYIFCLNDLFFDWENYRGHDVYYIWEEYISNSRLVVFDPQTSELTVVMWGSHGWKISPERIKEHEREQKLQKEKTRKEVMELYRRSKYCDKDCIKE